MNSEESGVEYSDGKPPSVNFVRLKGVIKAQSIQANGN